MCAFSLAQELCKALEEEDPEAVDALLKQGADPNLLLPDGIAAVHLAAGKERESAVRCLNLILQHGGNPNVRSVEDLTPLHVAASWGCYKCLKLLLRRGGDPSLKDQDGNCAVDLALEQGNRICFMLLQDYYSCHLSEERSEENSPKQSHDSYSTKNRDSLFSSMGTDPSSISRFSERSGEVEILNSTRKSCLRPALTSELNSILHDDTVIAGINYQEKRTQDSQSSCEKALQDALYSSGIIQHVHKPSDCHGRDKEHSPSSTVLSGTRVSSLSQGNVNTESQPEGEVFLEDESILCMSQAPAWTFLHPQMGCDIGQKDMPCNSHISSSKKYMVNSTSQYMTKEFASGDISGLDTFAPSTHLISEVDNPATPNGCSGSKMPCDGSGVSLVTLDSRMMSSSLGKKRVSFCKGSQIISFQESEIGLSCSSRPSNIDVTPHSSEDRQLLDSDGLPKIFENQGLDATSPDHAYYFQRGVSSSDYDLDRTVINPAILQKREQTEDDGGLGSEVQVQHCSSSSDNYESCDSDWYMNAAEASVHEGDLKRNSENRECVQETCHTKHTSQNCKGTSTGSSYVEAKMSPTQESQLQCTINSAAHATVALKDISKDDEQQSQLKDLFSIEKYMSPATFCAPRTESLCTQLVQNKGIRSQASDNLLTDTETLPVTVLQSQETLPEALVHDCSGLQQNTIGELSKQLKSMMLATKWKNDPPPYSVTQETVMIEQDSGSSSSSESKDTSLSRELKKMLMLTKTAESFTPQGNERPCYITARTKSRVTSSSSRNSSSSSLFDNTLDMPKRGRRLRNQEGVPQCLLASDSQMKDHGPRKSQENEYNPVHCQHLPMKEHKMLKVDHTEIVQNEVPSCSSQRKYNVPIACSPTMLLKHDIDGSISDFLTDDRSSSGSEGLKHSTVSYVPLPTSNTAKVSSENTWLTEDEGNSCMDTTTCMTANLWDFRALPLSMKAYTGSSNKQIFHNTQLDDPRFPEKEGGGQPCVPRFSFSRLSTIRPPSVVPVIQTISDKLTAIEDSSSHDITLSPGGRPVNMSKNESVEYLYTDNEEGHALIEKHFPCTEENTAETTSSEETIIYDWRMYKSNLEVQECKASQTPRCNSSRIRLDLLQLSNEEIERKLRDFGENPGPITSLTRWVYLALLDKLMKDPQSRSRKETIGYSPELTLTLQTSQIPECQGDEMALSKQFDQPDRRKKWREGILKSSFNYLLLDPRVTRNLPARCHSLSQVECFCTFVNAIFYVGKGKRARPYCHLYEALTHYKTGRKQTCPKVQQILDIWQGGLGVISLHCFQNVIPVEAYTREACMVDAIGLKMLTNRKRGDYYGCALSWSMKRRRCLGVHMLHRAMQIFLAEGERQLRPADIRIGQ
ncbi:ankyrin repeat and LEM domain-containing protein 1 [Microcaecilia unicolor]|uniref:Ankyrin repeat and LEM domain-containing protein 1 n=1 Tax=Microcaecilia unicolor TaxID=1415580 RepID=A0A6P7ZK99_9AMPH|nr:ankyrin repeat and LEM domain-containing protein 1 [Microcaecilia unicolor]